MLQLSQRRRFKAARSVFSKVRPASKSRSNGVNLTSQKQELEEIKAHLKQNAELIKPAFGMMFWQLQNAEERLNPEDFAEQGMKLTLDQVDDEVIATFITTYVKLWLSAKDFNAASRFVADCLSLSADELLQSRQVYINQTQS